MTATATPDAAAAWREHRTTSGALFALVLLVAFESFAVTTVMPEVATALGGRELYAFAFAGPLATGVVGMVVAGAWSDRRGPMLPLATGALLFVLGLVLAGAAPTMPVLVAGRLAQGLGGGVVNVTLLVAVARVYPPALHPRAMALFSTAWVLPSIVGPTVAGLVAQLAGWRWVFTAVAVLAVPATLPLLRAMRGTGGTPRDEAPAGGTSRRVVLSAAAAGAVLALNLAATLPRPWSQTVAVVAALAAVAAVRPLLPVGSLRARPGLPSVITTRLLVSGAFFGAQVYVPLLLVDRDGWSTAAAGLALSGAALAWTSMSLLQGRLGARLRHRTAARVGTALVAGAVIGTTASVALGLPPWTLALTWTVAGAGMGLGSSRLNVLLLAWSPPGEQGRNSASNSIADSVGAALSLALTGVVVAVAGGADGYTGPGPFVAALVLTAALACGAALVAPRVGVPPTERPDGPAAAVARSAGSAPPTGERPGAADASGTATASAAST